MAFQFSVGTLTATPTSGTPFSFGTLQDVSIDFDLTLKELFGSYQFPVDIAPGTMKINGKAKFATINGMNLNDLFFKGTHSGAGTPGGTSTVTVTNQLIGTVVPSFSLVWAVNYNSKSWTLSLNKCISKKLSFAGKLEDYIIPDFDFQAFADSSNGVFNIVNVN